MTHSAKNITATGDVSTGDTTLVAVTNGGTAGSVVLRDGGSGGTVKATFPVGVGAHLEIPGGMRFVAGLHATLDTTNDISFWLGGA